jgi:type I restriction enzyme S subunit
MTFAAFRNAKVVRSSWLDDSGRRLDCNPYMSGALEARDALQRLSVPKHPLRTVAERIFHAGREGRLWVNEAGHGVPFLGSSNILDADFGHLPLLANKQVRRNPLFTLGERWTLITRSGTIGRMAYVRPGMAGMACSEHVLRVVPDASRIPPGYLYAFLSSRFGVPLVVSGTYGAIIQHIEPEHISGLPVPRFSEQLELRISSLIEEAAVCRANASHGRKQAVALLEQAIGWQPSGTLPLVSVIPASGIARRMDAFHHSVGVRTGVAALSSAASERLGELVASVYEPNRGSRLKVTDPAYGVPFLSSSSVFELNPTGEYMICRSRTPHIDALLLSTCDVLLPRSGQIGGIIGRAVLPHARNIGHAGSEHLVRVRCRSALDAAYLWAVLASEPGYWATIGTAFGSSIPSLDAGLVRNIRVPWLHSNLRANIATLVADALKAQDKGTVLESAAVALVEEKIAEGA